MANQSGKCPTRSRRGLVLCLLLLGSSAAASAQDSPAGQSVRLLGTVTALQENSLILTPDKGEPTTLRLSPETRVLDLPPGSTDLKAARSGALTDLAVGDRVLITEQPGQGVTPPLARRVVVMKLEAIAHQRASDQTGWAHSVGGKVGQVDLANRSLTVIARGQTVLVSTTGATIFRRYAADSARFEDSRRGEISDVHVGDQIRVRGEVSGASVQAAEMISGTFDQISGNVTAMDAVAGTITLRDARTKQDKVVTVTARTEIHQLPPEVAAQFAARSQAGGKSVRAGVPAEGNTSGGRPEERDLGRVVAQLPNIPLAAMKIGQSLLLVATGHASTLTALTILTGVEPILAAMENGGTETSLAPWAVGGGEGAGGATQ